MFKGTHLKWISGQSGRGLGVLGHAMYTAVYVGASPGFVTFRSRSYCRSNFAINNRSGCQRNGNLSSKLELELRRKRYVRAGTEQVDKSNTLIFAGVRRGGIEDTVRILIHSDFFFFARQLEGIYLGLIPFDVTQFAVSAVTVSSLSLSLSLFLSFSHTHTRTHQHTTVRHVIYTRRL